MTKVGQRGEILTFLSVGLLYLGFAVIATYPLAFHVSDHVYGHGDPTLNIWAIAWLNHQLPLNPLALFDGNIFYPYARTLALSEHLLVPSLLASPSLAATDNPVLAHNLVILLSLALAGFGTYMFCRELTGDAWASFGPGLLYAFHTWNINELLRIQIVSNQWFPFLLWSLLRFFRNPGRKNGWLAGLFYALQSLSCMYWALYIPLIAFPFFLFLQRRHRLSWKALSPLLAGLCAAMLLTGMFTIPYLLNARAFGYEREEPAPLPLERYVNVLSGNLLYEEALGTARVNESAAHFLGFGAMALGALAFWPRRSAVFDSSHALRAPLGLLALSGFLLSLGPEIRIGTSLLAPGPYALLYRFLPGFGNVRYPERFCLFLVLGLAPLTAMSLSRIRAAAGRSVVIVLGILVFAEHLSIPLELQSIPTGGDIPQVYRWLAKEDDVSVLAQVPATRYWTWRMDVDSMYFSTVHWKRTVQGFTGFMPPTTNFIRWRLFHFPGDESVAFLEKLGVDTVVVSPSEMESWNLDDPRWSLVGPFPEGHIVLRLKNSKGLRFGPPERGDTELIELDPSEWRTNASSPGAQLARDRDVDTAWSTVDMQSEHHFYAIRFPEPTAPARISMEIGRPYQFPTRFQVLGLIGGDQWVDIPFDRHASFDRFFAELLHQPFRASLDIDLDAPRVREIRIRVTETDPFEMPWTMSEIRAFLRKTPR
jgi:hypothetical protein